MTKTNKRRPKARERALNILHQVADKGAYANLTLNKMLNKADFNSLDRGFITELVYGTLRMQGRLDYILGQYLKKPLASLPLWILLILRLGAYQIIFLDKVPVSAAVHESVELAKKYGHAGTVRLVNGVLRNVDRGRENIKYPSRDQNLLAYLTAFYSHPAWLVSRWLEEFGPEETEKLCIWNNTSPQVTLRANTLKTTREDLIKELEHEGIKASMGTFLPESLVLPGAAVIGSLAAYRDGLFQVQDEGSMLVTRVLNPQPGSKMLDICAAPGGKTTHAAQLMANQGEIKAFDLYPHKLALIEANCRRLGISIVTPQEQDGRKLPGIYEKWADYCLVDAPCSGLGVLRRRPDARWQKQASDIGQLVTLQKEILTGAAKTVAPGGLLVYSTCTITPEENQGVVAWFLKGHPEFSLEEIPRKVIGKFSFTDDDLAGGMLQLLPHVHGTDGLFMARLRKRG